MEDHETRVREDVRQCHTIREHRKAERHDRLARVRSLLRVAGELVPLVVVDEDGRDVVVVFLDHFDLSGRRAAAHGRSLRRASAAECRPGSTISQMPASALQFFAYSQSVGTVDSLATAAYNLMQCCDEHGAMPAGLRSTLCLIIACGPLAQIPARSLAAPLGERQQGTNQSVELARKTLGC